MNKQMQFADASGDAVIVRPGPDGERILTRKSPGDGYLLPSDLDAADPSHGYGHPCSRYDKAQDLLGQLLDQGGELSVRDAVKVLDAAHQEGGTSWTIGSLLADLPNGQIYLYHFSQFNEPVWLNVVQEIATPRPSGPLSTLFPADVQQEAARRYQRIQANASRCRWLSITWVPAVFACLMLLIILSLGKKRETGRRSGLFLWVPVVTILGPLGLLVWLAVARARQPSIWRTALVEASGDVMPTVVAYAAYLSLMILVPELLSGEAVRLVLMFGLPLAIGCFAFQGPLLALALKQRYLGILGQRLPQALVAANLGMAGIHVVAAPLVRKSSQPCFTLGALWAIIALGALAGGSLLFVYELWAVRHGFHAWDAVALRQDQVLSPSWRRLKGWIPLSYAVLFGSLVLSMLLQQQ
jgi:hypothetical protein